MLKRAAWINVALAAAVAALGLWMLGSPDGGRRDGDADAPAATAVFAIDAKAVSALRIERPGEPPIVVERTAAAATVGAAQGSSGGSTWTQTAPFRARVDASRISRLLDVLQMKSRRTLPATDLASFGLAPANATVTFDAVAVGFGVVNPVTQELYVHVGDRVHLVEPTWSYGLPAPRTTLATHMPLDGDEQVVAIALPDGVRIAKTDGRWTLSPDPAADRMPSQDDLVRFVEQWRYLSAPSTTAAPAAPRGEVVAVTFDGGATARFVVTQRAPSFVLVREDERLAFTLPADEGAKLLALPARASAATSGSVVSAPAAR
jgi:hypothetical protein